MNKAKKAFTIHFHRHHQSQTYGQDFTYCLYRQHLNGKFPSYLKRIQKIFLEWLKKGI